MWAENHALEQSLFLELSEHPRYEAERSLRERDDLDDELRQRLERLLLAHWAATGVEPTDAHDRARTGHRPSEPTPDRIGPFSVTRLLGEGGMGMVYAAEQSEPIRRSVAIKLIKPGMHSREVVARFGLERQALAIMNHPGIAKIIDAGLHEHRPYFVMELVNGQSVARYCEANDLDLEGRIDLFLKIADAVQHAHSKGVIHRDLKPSNILVADHDGRREPKIIDFGIAKALELSLSHGTQHTLQGQLLGTPAYMSPEQLESGIGGVDTRSDVYALGAVLYELLVGRPPFDQKTLASSSFDETKRLILEVDPPRPSVALARGDGGPRSGGRGWIAELRRDLDWIVMRCLEKDRTRRYASASAIGDDLRRYIRREPVESGPPTTAYRMRKFFMRRRVPVTAAALVALALVGGVVATSLALAEAAGARNLAEARTREATEQRELAEREAARAGAVSEFLIEGLLSSVDPGESEDHELTMREALDNAAAGLEGRFEDQPLTEAAVRSIIGSMYEKLSRPVESEAQQRRVIDLYERSYGPKHPSTIVAIDQLATSLMSQRRIEEARVVLDEEIERIRAGDPIDQEALLRAMSQRATIPLMLENFAEAAPLLEEALVLKTQFLGPEHQSTLTSMHNLAGLRFSLGQHERALELYRSAHRGRERALGPGDPATILSKLFAAASLFQLDRMSEALELATETTETARRVAGPVHRVTHMATAIQAQFLRELGRLEEAGGWLDALLTDERRELGDEHPQTVDTIGLLGGIRVDQGDHDAAETLLVEAVSGLDRLYGRTNSRAVNARDDLARALAAQGRFGEAESAVRPAADAIVAERGTEHPFSRVAIGTMVDLYRAWHAAEPGAGIDSLANEWEALRGDEATAPASGN